MTGIALRVLRHRWQLAVGSVCAIMFGVALVHSGIVLGSSITAERPPAGLDAGQRAAFNQAVDGASTLNGLSSGLGLFLTVFVVRSTLDFAVTQRRRELAQLRLVGATRRQMRGLLLVEALMLGCLGVIAGVPLGMALAAVERHVYVARTMAPGPLNPVNDHAELVAALFVDATVGILTALVGAWSSSRRATRITALDALHQRDLMARAMTTGRWITGLLALSLTAAQVVLSVRAHGWMLPLMLGLGTIASGSVAATQFAPLAVPLVAVVLQPFARGPIMHMAMSKLRDDARRATHMAGPAVLLISLVVGLQGVVDTQSAIGRNELVRSTGADLLVTTHGDPSHRLAELAGVASADTEFVVSADVMARGAGATTLTSTVVAIDPRRFASLHPHAVRWGSFLDFTDHSVVLGPGLADDQLPPPGTPLTLRISGRNVPVAEAARTGEGLAATADAYIPRALVPPQVLQAAPSTVLVKLRPDTSPDNVRRAITGLGVGKVMTPTTMAEVVSHQQDTGNHMVMVALVGLGSLYALISLLNTVAIATLQRRPEFAVDRLSGLTRRQVLGMAMCETTLAVGIGIALGGCIAVSALLGLWTSTWHAYGFPVIAIPWSLGAAMAACVGLLAVVTADVSARVATNRRAMRDLTETL